jgi:hypothetical protein
LKQHVPWFNEEYSELWGQRKQAKLRVVKSKPNKWR